MFMKLRKFGLKHCDLPTMVANTTTLLRILSLNLDPLHKKKIPTIFYIFTVITFSCYIYVYVFSMIWFVFCKCPQTGDVIGAMVVFALGIASEISVVKLIYMFINQNTLRNTITDYLSYDARDFHSSNSTRKILEVLRRVKKTAITFWFMVIGNGFVYCVKPLLLPGRHLMEDTEFLYGLDPLFVTPNYEIGYILCLNACTFIVYTTANISAFFIIFTGYIEAQMLSLSEDLVNIWEDAQIYYNENTNVVDNIFGEISEDSSDKLHVLNKYIKDQLRIIVIKHTTNIHFLNKIEDVFRGSMAIEFGLLIISLIAEFLGGIENTYLLIPFALAQVTMDCITGQKLLDSSDMFQRAVYDCKWENFNVTNRRTVLIILMNSQKDMTLSVGGLRQLNYVCLMGVFRFIHSTYTTLSTVVHY